MKHPNGSPLFGCFMELQHRLVDMANWGTERKKMCRRQEKSLENIGI
jgi:hypothetical protein